MQCRRIGHPGACIMPPGMTDLPDPSRDEPGESRRWDADDPRRREDQFAPPAEVCECYCLHCGRVFMSDQIWLQRVVGDKSGFGGFWMCPTPNCGGAGFTFDIFPTDPDHPANEGWFDDEEDDDEYDPEEPQYSELEEHFLEDDDIEGEEWKHGLAPGEKLPEPEWAEQARREYEQEQKKYDEPDQRPRELDWSNRDEDIGGIKGDDEIPF